MRKLSLLLLFISCISYSQQNLKQNYTPLKSSGTLPDIFTQNIRNVIKDDITELNKQKEEDRGIKSNYLTAANYEIEKIVKSGNTLINDEVTTYLNELAGVILKNNPTLKNQLHIYTLKSPVVNAYSYDKGYIFIDIGLIAQAETEAQLAYILSHEISHYVKKHNINGYVKNTKIDKKNYSGKTSEDKLIEKCQYSKEYESEADIEGFKLLEQTNYDFKQAEKAFDVLQYAHLPFELVEFQKTYFNNSNYKIPDSYFLKEVSSIRNNSAEDDTKHTHPNTAKRKQAIAELISKRNNSGRVNYIIGKEKFDYIRDLSRMELCRLYLKNRDYMNAFYAAYILEKKYPQNEYVAEIMSKCMYALTLYSRGDLRYDGDSYLENGIPSYSDIESYPQQLYYLANKMPTNEWTILSMNYVYRNHKKFPNNVMINAYSDSLFKIMGNTNWEIFDFVRTNKRPDTTIVKTEVAVAKTDSGISKTDLIATIQKENNFKSYDTAYYKEIYVDLFMNDKEFTSKFPLAGIKSENSSSGFTTYTTGSSNKIYTTSKPKKDKKVKYQEIKVEKVILLDPFYLKINEKKEEEVRYVDSDTKQEKFVVTVNECAQKQNFEIVNLDPSLITSGQVDKVNDYSIMNDWFSEKFDATSNSKNPILNTNDINTLIKKYATQYVLKTGIVNYKSKRGRKATYYYAFVYDLVNNEMVYKKQEIFRGKDTKDLVNAKVYQTLFELKRLKKKI
ncbi:MAG: M48 family metallopeptidase [Bacteroidota bacterium]